MALENIGKFFGSFYQGYNQPYQSYKNRQADEALQRVIELERQKELARQTASQPIPEGMATVAPEWGKSDKLQLHQAYNRAGLDPKKIAESQTAQLASEAFANAIPNITSDTGRINIGLGKEYRPDVYRHDEIKADDAQIRLNTVEGLLGREDIDPLLAADISQNKAVFDAKEVEIEGEDGKRHKAFANLTPSGSYVASTVKDRQGQPLNIPPEDSGKSSPEMTKAKELAQYGLVTDIKDGLEMVYSSRSKSPGDFWADIISKKSINRFGNNVKPYDMLKNSMVLWSSAKQDHPIPVDIEKTLNTYDLNDRQQEELLNLANQINENARLISLSKVAEEETASGTAKLSLPNLPGFAQLQQPQQQPQQNTPFYQMPGVGVAGAQPAAQQPPPIPVPPLPQEPIPETQPLSIEAIATALTDIAQKGKKPEAVRKDLMKQGFDLSPESINQMAMESMAEDTPAEVLQQFFATIGIDWQPT